MKNLLFFSILFLSGMNATGHDFNRLESYLNKKVAGVITPGVQYIITDSHGILYEYNKGLANIENGVRVDSNTQFKMYSSTKLLTMLAVMQMVEEGKIDLVASVSKYISYDFPKDITVRKVLSHTAGFSRYPFVKEIHPENEHDDFNYSEFINKMLPKHKELSYSPGKKNRYSNYGFLVLSAIVEEVSGISYEKYVNENLIEPAKPDPQDYVGFNYTGQTATGYQRRRTIMHWIYSGMVNTDRYYGAKTKKWQSYNNLYMEGVGFGGGFANARGLSKLFIALLNNNIISENTLQATFESQMYNKEKVSKQALGWWNGSVAGNKSYYHPGGGGGYSCEVRVYPEKGIVRIMMLNKTQTYSDLRMFSKIDRLWLKEL